MKNTTRKHGWPVALAMAFAVVAMLAAFVTLTALPGDVPGAGAGEPLPGAAGRRPERTPSRRPRLRRRR